jgi:hypothetical protein
LIGVSRSDILRAMDAARVIEEFGGPAAVAARFGAGRTAVYNWRREGIPARYWLAFVEAARQDGKAHITADAIQWRPAPRNSEAA